ncbi:MAG: hypothetical protein HY302_06800 [Opitutae bacterium]|nr:hypothetical protein [Opitutae bacterium]
MSSPPNTRCAPKPSRTERGSALITVLLLAAVISLFAVHLLQRAVLEEQLAARSVAQSVAGNLAEGGIEDALFAANNGYFNSTYGWTTASDSAAAKVKTTTGLAVTQGSGEVFLRVDNYASSSPTIIALGVFRPLTGAPVVKQLRCGIVRRSTWSNGMVSKSVITFSGNATVDSYDSSLGVYNASTNRGDQATVASNSTALDSLVLNSNAVIYGYAATGGAAPNVSSNGRIYGATSPANPKVDPSRVRTDFNQNIPDATAPTVAATSLGSVSSGTTLPRVGDSPGTDGRYHYTATSISLAGNNTLSVTGPVDLTVTGNLAISGNGQISIGGSGSVSPSLNIYAAGSVALGGNGMLNQTNVPGNTALYGTAPSGTTQSISVTGNGEFIGAVYAPNANVSLTGNGAVNGAVIANNITLGGNGTFHYDVHLAVAGTTTSSTADRYYRPDTWIELTDKAGTGAAFARDNRPPFNAVL